MPIQRQRACNRTGGQGNRPARSSTTVDTDEGLQMKRLRYSLHPSRRSNRAPPPQPTPRPSSTVRAPTMASTTRLAVNLPPQITVSEDHRNLPWHPTQPRTLTYRCADTRSRTATAAEALSSPLLLVPRTVTTLLATTLPLVDHPPSRTTRSAASNARRRARTPSSKSLRSTRTRLSTAPNIT